MKSFRDLEVYQKTVALSAQLFSLPIPAKYAKRVGATCEKLVGASQEVPKLIAESYGDKFSDLRLAVRKLESAMRLIADIVTGIDVLRAVLAEEKDSKVLLDELLAHYQRQKMKILNLQRAWQRVFGPKRQ
ncbi:MAG: hypothetical protein Q8R13_05390 [bacterium]|nr:hypothetical protein [bacterium]MDZ4296663.1 hypothetical protein [Patescibacteria group bacterium]